tara:strand:+ start:128 stop:565 length:438 start_codon:yes stop_codon:yes gene_type:complete
MKRFLEFISENWSEATPEQQRFATKKFVYHVTTPERAEKIKKTGLKPSKKSEGKFKDLQSQKTPSSFVTSSRGLDYWTNAVSRALNVGEEGITVLKYPVQNLPKNVRRKMELDHTGSKDASRDRSRSRPAYKITKTLGGKRRRDK